MRSAFKIQNLSVIKNDKILLDHLDCHIPAGEISLILGANGAGKTLLLRCLAGLQIPQQGQILNAQDENLINSTPSETSKFLAWTPSSVALPFAFKVDELLVMGRYRWHQGYPSHADYQAVCLVLEQLELQSLAKRIYNTLSRGEQTRVDIARALATEAPVLLFDEPFANLDIDASIKLIELLRQLKQQGKTIILSHHDLYTVSKFGDHLLFLKQGKLVGEGPCRDNFTAEMIRTTYGVETHFHSQADPDQQFVRFSPLV